MDESWNRFWDRLIIDSVTVLVGTFVVQGVWYAMAAALSQARPDLVATLDTTSSRLVFVWALIAAVGVTWAFVRALEARKPIGSPR